MGDTLYIIMASPRSFIARASSCSHSWIHEGLPTAPNKSWKASWTGPNAAFAVLCFWLRAWTICYTVIFMQKVAYNECTYHFHTHFFQLESYIFSSRTSDLCDFPIAHVVPAILFVTDHKVSKISPSTWPIPWIKLSENFRKQLITCAPKCHFPTAGSIVNPEGTSRYLLFSTLR